MNSNQEPGSNFYKLLGVTVNASLDDLKKAYRKKAKEYHPDLGGNIDMMKELNKAYGILTNPEKKAEYDELNDDLFDNLDSGERLTSGFKLSDTFKQILQQAKSDFSNFNINDTRKNALQKMIKLMRESFNPNYDQPPTSCPVCGNPIFVQLQHHQTESRLFQETVQKQKTLDQFFQEINPSPSLQTTKDKASKFVFESEEWPLLPLPSRFLWLKTLFQLDKEQTLLLKITKIASELQNDPKVCLNALKSVKGAKTPLAKLFVSLMTQKELDDKNHALVMSALHLILSESTIQSSEKISEIARFLWEKQNEGPIDVFNVMLNNYDKDGIVMVLQDWNQLASGVVEKTLKEQIENKQIDEAPDFRKAIAYLLQSFLCKWKGNYAQSVDCLFKSLYADPKEDMIILGLISEMSLRYGVLNDFNKKLQFHSNQPTSALSDIPRILKYSDKLQPNKLINVLKKNEKAINHTQKQLSALEKAYCYIDLSMAVRHDVVVCNNFLLAANLFLEHMKSTDLNSEKFGCFAVIESLIGNIFALSNDKITPSAQLYFLLHILTLMLQSSSLPIAQVANSSKKPSSQNFSCNLNLFEAICKEMNKKSKISPVIGTELLSSFDLLYKDLIDSRFLNILLKKQLQDNKDSLVSQETVVYQLLEGEWNGWIQESDHRQECMTKLLKKKKFTPAQIRENMIWKTISRDKQGWRAHSSKPRLQFQDDNIQRYSSIDGITFNIDTGEVALKLTGPIGNFSLFDDNDIKEILQNGISLAVFTLDPPDNDMPYHPFQEMKYLPKELGGTNLLQTLLQCDYLLKELTCSVEVSAEPPFDFKPISSGLLKNLPQDLQEICAAMQDARSTRSGTAHRFWIEACEIEYEEKRQGNVFTYELYDPEMIVKKHLLMKNKNGELVDANEDSSDDSREGTFAKGFSDNYDEFGEYYPELLRLRELNKIIAMIKIMKNMYLNIEDQATTVEVDMNKIMGSLKDAISEITYPAVNSLEQELDKCLASNHVTRSQVAAAELQRVTKDIKSHLEEADIQHVDQFMQILKKLCNIPNNSTTTNHAKSFLQYKSSNELTKMIQTNVIQQRRDELSKILTTMKKMKLKIDKNPVHELSNSGCPWVPAAFANGDQRRVYGGVDLQARLSKIDVPTRHQQISSTKFQVENTYRPRTGVPIKSTTEATLFHKVPATEENLSRLKRGLNPKGMDWHHLNQNKQSVTLMEKGLHQKVPHKMNLESVINRKEWTSTRRAINKSLYKQLTEQGINQVTKMGFKNVAKVAATKLLTRGIPIVGQVMMAVDVIEVVTMIFDHFTSEK